MKTTCTPRRSAFTLIELLVVMAVIAIIAAGIGLALRGGDSAARLRAGEVTLSSYLQAARSQAILKRQPVRVIVRDESADRELHWRQLGMVVRDAAERTRWHALDDGVLLPEGVYCWPVEPATSWAGRETMQIEFPRAQAVAEGAGPRWFYIEFEPAGTVKETGMLELMAGRWEPDMSAPEPFDEDRGLYRRFGLSRLGAVIVLEQNEEVPE